MIKLNSITLSNIRRFSKNVKIDISSGATIFLAPNGTGKTAIFEALELALTRKVNRFKDETDNKDDYDFSPIIRDQQNAASIKLDFGDNGCSRLVLSPGSSPSFDGDISSLYGNPKDEGGEYENLPFLLRTTHLLDQSHRSWFVQTDEKEAGNQLNYLSIGKDASRVNQLMTGAKRASGKLRQDAEKEYASAQTSLDDWFQLLKERDELLNNEGNPLAPLKQLYNNITEIATPHVAINEKYENNVSFVKTIWAKATSAIDDLINDKNKRIENLSSLKSIPDEYDKQQKNILENENLLEEKVAYKINIEKKLENKNNKLVKQEELNKVINKKLSVLDEIERKKTLLNKVKIKIDNNKKQEDALKRSIISNEYILIFYHKEIKKIEEFKNKYTEIKGVQRVMLKDSETLSLMKNSLVSWSDYSSQLDKLSAEIVKNVEMRETIKQKISNSRNKKFQIETSYKKAKLEFESLDKASSLVREAVVSISEHLSKEQDDCPVCGVIHGSSILQKKILESLGSMNPELVPAKERMEKISEQLEEENKHSEEISVELSITNAQLEKNQNLEKELQANISEFKMGLFPECNDIQEAKIIYDKKINDLDALRQRLEREKSDLPQEPKEHELVALKLKTDTLQNKINTEQRRVKEMELELSRLKEQKESIVSSLGHYDISIVSKNMELQITNLQEELIKNDQVINELRVEKDVLVRKLNETDDIITTYNRNISTFIQDSSVLLEKWRSLNLDDPPSTDELTKVIHSANELLQGFQEKRISLKQIGNELSRWSVMDSLDHINSKIKHIRRDLSEEVCTNQLLKTSQKAKEVIEDIRKKHEVLCKFHEHLKLELDNTLEHVRRFAPLRNKLLNKVVVDSRYSKVDTFINQFRGKQHAGTTTNLHGNNVVVSKTASEAQLTDLQLTFLLSMAKVHNNWIGWKALMLDDPTQHHDLVHAAGVFDLLRDYIVDDDFQVILSTHDSVQANFFKRKLENDGVPVQIWELAAREDGVEAFKYR